MLIGSKTRAEPPPRRHSQTTSTLTGLRNAEMGHGTDVACHCCIEVGTHPGAGGKRKYRGDCFMEWVPRFAFVSCSVTG